jgi:hypothetical protein
MKFRDFTMAASRAVHNAGFQLKKHSPEILVVAGVVGTVTSAVMACKATTKVNFILEETKQKLDIIHEGAENGEVQGYLENGEVGMIPYTVEDSKKDTTIVYTQTGLQFAKLYAPSVLLGAASIACILGGHHILRKRNLALAAAYTAVDTGFKQYRNRVVERLGEKMDKELLYNIKAKTIEETVTDENGNETTVTKTVEVADPVAAMSPYTVCFDETCTGWTRDAEANKFFLHRQQDYANEKLRSEGRLFLNDVLKMVGAKQTRAGQTVGWVYDENNPIGDNYVDFGMYDIRSEASRNFANGLEKSIWLTFNVDGDILNSL